MSLPFVLTFTGLVLNFLVAPTKLGLGWLRTHAVDVAALALVLGALGFVNLWDLPVFGALFAGAALAKVYGQERAIAPSILRALSTAIPVAVLALLLYLPFYLSFDSQAQGVLPVEEYVTRPFHFLVIWGLFLFIALPFLAWELVSVSHRPAMEVAGGSRSGGLSFAPLADVGAGGGCADMGPVGDGRDDVAAVLAPAALDAPDGSGVYVVLRRVRGAAMDEPAPAVSPGEGTEEDASTSQGQQ